MANKQPLQHLIQLDIQTKYEQLCSVKVLHDYFKEGGAQGVEIAPDSMTTLRLKQYNLKFAQEGAGLVVGYGANSQGAAIAQLTEPIKLTFWMKIKDQYFLNYTDIPYEFGDYVYHFTNRDADKIEDEFANLSSDEFVKEIDKLPLAGAMLDYRFDEPMEDVEVEVVNELGEVVYERSYSGMTSVCSVNLADEPAGKYTLLLDGLDEFSFYIAPEGAKGVFGVIDIYIDPTDNGPFTLFNEDGSPVVRKEYKIHFQARAVKWKYIFMETNPSNPQHSDYEVYDNTKGDTELYFTDVAETVLDNGTNAFVVKTENPIPFKEEQKERFKLRTLRGKSGVEWITDLPSASAKFMLKVEKDGEKDVYSELIVYL